MRCTHTHRIFCRHMVHAVQALWHIWNVSRPRYILKRTWCQPSSNTFPPCCSTLWQCGMAGSIWADGVVWHTQVGAQLQRVWACKRTEVRRGTGLGWEDWQGAAVLPWGKRSVEPVTMGSKTIPCTILCKVFFHHFVGYTQERHDAISFVQGHKISLSLCWSKQALHLKSLWSKMEAALS